MKINVDCFDKYVELQFPTEDRRLTYKEAEELKNKLINSLENYQKQRKKTEKKIFDNCVYYRENQTHCEKHFYIYNCRGCKFYKTNPIFDKIAKLDKRISNLEKVYLKEDDDFEALDLSSIKEICNAFERVYGKEEKNCKYHFKIEEHGSCYSLDKIVFNERCSSIATIWFNDVFPDSNMLSKEKAYEIIQNIKKHLEEVNE